MKLGLLSTTNASFSIAAAIWSKTSFGLTLLRIVEGRWKTLVWLSIVIVNVTLGGSIAFEWVQCNPTSPNGGSIAGAKCVDPNVIVQYGIVSGGKFCHRIHLCMSSADQ
jgi:hypothetical protein